MFFLKIDDDLEMRLIQMNDAKKLSELINANRQHLRTWLPWVDYMVAPHQFYSIVSYWLYEYHQNTGLRAGIFYKGKLNGCIELHNVDYFNRLASMGYFLAKTAEGKGLVTRSAKALIEYAFTVLGLNRIEIRAGEKNVKSRAIPERLGFTMEGKIRQGEFLHGYFQHIILYGLIKDDWRHQKFQGNKTALQGRKDR